MVSAMKKKIFSLALAASMFISLSGCAGIFSKEYLYVTDYVDNSSEHDGDETVTVSDFDGLKNAVSKMVEDQLTEGKLIFSNYSGDLQSDLSQVGWSVKSENALADYCVDYVSYYLNRIVTYYEAQIHITYKRTASEVQSIIPVAGLTGFKEQLSKSLNDCAEEVAVQWYARSLTQEDVASAIKEVYFSDPSASVVSPTPEITIHSSSTAKNIVELSFKYGYSDSQLMMMKEELNRKIGSIVAASHSDSSPQFARNLCESIASGTELDKANLPESPVSAVSLSSTVYGALIAGKADNLGMALAYQALCKSAGIESTVISGTLNHHVHYWNSISIDGVSSYVDVSSFKNPSVGLIFMMSDSQIESRGYSFD